MKLERRFDRLSRSIAAGRPEQPGQPAGRGGAAPAIDDVSRLFAIDISRRQAIRLAGGVLAGAVASRAIVRPGNAAAAGGTCYSGGLRCCANIVAGPLTYDDCCLRPNPQNSPGVCWKTGDNQFLLCPRCPTNADFSLAVSGQTATVTVTDPSGIRSVVATCSPSNCTPATVTPSLTGSCPGPTHVAVTVHTISPSKRTSLRVVSTNCAGESSIFDPIMATIGLRHGFAASERLTGLGRAESRITISNARPGLAKMGIAVNGKKLTLGHLAPGAVKTIDVAPLMHAGNDNTIVLTALGSAAGSATVLVQ